MRTHEEGRECAALAAGIRAVRVGDEILPKRLHEHLSAALSSTVSVMYSLRSTETLVEVDALTTHARSAASVRAVLNDNLSKSGSQGPFIHLRPALAQRNRVFLLSDLLPDAQVRAEVRKETGMHRLGLAEFDQVRVLLCEGDSLQAFFGAYRAEPFTARHRQLVSGLVPALRERMQLLTRLPLAQVTFAALEAMLASSASPAGLVDARGRIVMGNQRLLGDARRWRTALAEAVRGDRSTFVTTKVDAPGLSPHYLVRQRARAATVDEAFVAKFGLTKREREVLEHIVAGRTNSSIAAMLVCSVRTAEAHASNLLRKTHTSSRTELIALLLSEQM